MFHVFVYRMTFVKNRTHFLRHAPGISIRCDTIIFEGQDGELEICVDADKNAYRPFTNESLVTYGIDAMISGVQEAHAVKIGCKGALQMRFTHDE